MNELLAWIGIVICVSQSATFSGLNLAVFGISRLRLEVEASTGNAAAARVLALRGDANFLLTTILWGNVGVNVLLALLSNSVMAGLTAFCFSTFVITFAGEIVPQAYFSRHALRMADLMAPVLRFYQVVLYPLAKPSALMLDAWLGREGIQYFAETDLREMILKHSEADEAELGLLEGLGAINFLDLDDVTVSEEGTPMRPDSVIQVGLDGTRPAFPEFASTLDDPFLQSIHRSRRKWCVLLDPDGEPRWVLDADGFLRDALLAPGDTQPLSFCHRPIVISDPATALGDVLPRLRLRPDLVDDEIIDHDVILVWAGDVRRVITGADLLGRLLRGIAR